MAKQTMAPAKEKPLTERQRAALGIATAMVSSTGYEILDQGDGEVARNLARRATEIADQVIAESAPTQGGAS